MELSVTPSAPPRKSRRHPSEDRFLRALIRFGDRLRTDDDALQAAGRDASHFVGTTPLAVVFPRSTEEVVRLAQASHNVGLPLVPRGSGTGKSGGCVPVRTKSVIVDFSQMNRICAIHPQDMTVTTQPGVITQTLDRAANEHQLFFPPDPASWMSSTIGGNIATNAGGPRALKYGSTQRYVWGLTAVKANGDVIRTGRRCLKGVTGLDLTSLLVGSEGTLAFITEATLHVLPEPSHVETAWLAFETVTDAVQASDRILARGPIPRTLELFDERALRAAESEHALPVREAHGAALLIETDGDETDARHHILRSAEVALNGGGAGSALAASEHDRAHMRTLRESVSPGLGRQYPHKRSDDVAVPRSQILALVKRVREHARQARIDYATYGHLGDGNLHVNLLCKTPEEQKRAAALRPIILRDVIALGGTLTAEHGLGAIKRNDLPLEQSETVIELQRALKRVFDPDDRMNPGKVLPSN